MWQKWSGIALAGLWLLVCCAPAAALRVKAKRVIPLTLKDEAEVARQMREGIEQAVERLNSRPRLPRRSAKIEI